MDPLTGKPLAGGPPAPQQGLPPISGTAQPPVNLSDYKHKEPPPLDLMTKASSDLAIGGAPPSAGQPLPPIAPNGPVPPNLPTTIAVEGTSPMKDYPGGLSAAALVAQQQQHQQQQQQAKVLSYYPYK